MINPTSLPIKFTNWKHISIEGESFSELNSHIVGWEISSDESHASNGSIVFAKSNINAGKSIQKKIDVPRQGNYSLWIRNKGYYFSEGDYLINLDLYPSFNVHYGKEPDNGFIWKKIGKYYLINGSHTISLSTTGKYMWAGVDEILLTDDEEYIPQGKVAEKKIDVFGKPKYMGMEKSAYYSIQDSEGWRVIRPAKNATASYYIWQDSDGWHIRWNGQLNDTFSGTIISHEGFVNISNNSFDSDDHLFYNKTNMYFTSSKVKGETGIDFNILGSEVIFDI